jgi:hypothetical protein
LSRAAGFFAVLCCGLIFAENNVLPDGSVFLSWELAPRWSQTYHVAQRAAEASDDNPGTEAKPWRTIGKAAAVLQPGERVVIHEGVYREWVKPARGGSGVEHMIGYEAAPGAEVLLKGSDEWTPQWSLTDNQDRPEGAAATWRAVITADLFAGKPNPFAQIILPAPPWKEDHQLDADLKCGQLFLDGQPLIQKLTYAELLQSDDAFWVESDGGAMHIRLKGDVPPARKIFEITTREQVFAPAERVSFIRVKGLRIFHAANAVPIPLPQHGALSAATGHHWIIEDCEVGYANTLGMDIGGQWWGMAGEMTGCMIVRRCHVHHCGVSGICGWHARANQQMLIEDNIITHCGMLRVRDHYETAAVKLHRVTGSLIRRNVFLRNRNSAALWLDGENTNTRVTQNLFYNTQDTGFGSFFSEINDGPILFDNNIIFDSSGKGVCVHDAGHLSVLQNLIAGQNGHAIHMQKGSPGRFGNGRIFQDEHRVFGNILADVEKYIHLPNRTSSSDGNLFGGPNLPPRRDYKTPFLIDLPEEKEFSLAQWRETGFDTNSIELQLTVSFDDKTFELRVKGPAGATLPSVNTPTAQRIAPMTNMTEVLQEDFLGNKRDTTRLELGPIIGLPLDGAPVRVDPRRPD